MDDKSGIGVHYVDAYIKPMNAKLPDGTAVKCKRRGLKITLQAGTKKGDGIMRRLEVSTDPVVMLEAALQEAAKNAGVELSVEDGARFTFRSDAFQRSCARRLVARDFLHASRQSKICSPVAGNLRAAGGIAWIALRSASFTASHTLNPSSSGGSPTALLR